MSSRPVVAFPKVIKAFLALFRGSKPMLGQSMGPKVQYGSMQGVEGSVLGICLSVGSYPWGGLI